MYAINCSANEIANILYVRYAESKIGLPIVKVFKDTEIIGILALLASIILQGRPIRSATVPPVLPTIVSFVHISTLYYQ